MRLHAHSTKIEKTVGQQVATRAWICQRMNSRQRAHADHCQGNLTFCNKMKNDELPLDLQENMSQIIAQFPPAKDVFEQLLAHFTCNKKRKLPTGNFGPVLSSFEDLGFMMPLRKKLHLRIHERVLSLGLQNESIEGALPISEISFAFCLPTPNKQKEHYTLILFKKSASDYAAAPESFVFGFDDKEPLSKNRVLDRLLAIPALKKLRILQPSPDVLKSFKSKPKRFLYNIDAYLKNKEGCVLLGNSGEQMFVLSL